MCLEILEKFKTTGVGWKTVMKDGKKYIPPVKSCEPYKKKQWNKDPNSYNIVDLYPLSYSTGFHIFTRKKDAKRWAIPLMGNLIIKKVKYRKVVATGYQENRKVVVAKEFKFIRR